MDIKLCTKCGYIVTICLICLEEGAGRIVNTATRVVAFVKNEAIASNQDTAGRPRLGS